MLTCLTQTERSIQIISGNSAGFSNNAGKQLGILKSQLEYVDIHDIFDTGLHEYLDKFQKKLNGVSTAIFETFFSIENVMNKPKI